MPFSALAPVTLALAPAALRTAGKIVEGFSLSNLLPGGKQGTDGQSTGDSAIDGASGLPINADVLVAQTAQLSQDIKSAIAELWERLLERIPELEDAPTGMIQLDIAPSGEVTVAGVSDPIAIEQAIGSDQELAAAFHELSAKVRLLKRLQAGESASSLSGKPFELNAATAPSQTSWRFH